MVSASAFSAACFCYLFGGSAVDAFTALAPALPWGCSPARWRACARR